MQQRPGRHGSRACVNVVGVCMQAAAAKQDRFVVRPSHIAGIGVYAVEDIPAKEVLMEYSGAACADLSVSTELTIWFPYRKGCCCWHMCRFTCCGGVGVLTRRVHADRLEDMYERMKCDHYLFSIDQSEYIVDATQSGGTCRFVNHSCGCANLPVSTSWDVKFVNMHKFQISREAPAGSVFVTYASNVQAKQRGPHGFCRRGPKNPAVQPARDQSRRRAVL